MALWRRLYNTVWLAFFCCVLLPRWMGAATGFPMHVLLGVLMIVITQSNVRKVGALPVPDRLKRISKTTAAFAIFQLVSGIALGALAHLVPNIPYVAAAFRGLHAICALAMLAQASSVATAYDMWEEKEFAG